MMPFKRTRWADNTACRCAIWFKVDTDLPPENQVLIYEPITTDQVVKVNLVDAVGARYYQWNPEAAVLEVIESRRDKKESRRSLARVTVEQFIRNDGGAYDDVKLTETRTVQAVLGRERRCPLHSLLSGQAWFEVIWEESRRHEITFEMAQDAHPSLDREGYVWEYDKDIGRVLRVRFPGLTLSSEETDDLQAALDIRLGPGQVVTS